ncbi:helix-turn-helix transcriptional regulator [Flavimaricola marinus]|uniref:Bacterial regulatory proteins, luxR family n=1 Tax=Flavimaricola marinus TaxID=1819565 RepID=A0A238LGV7_9RHOB|nr:helix-turn-helix transcriptional regulator [Flavimaricola marinus]SMY08929.1 Bacterial regulatory proteins, luxR family [Flavimaricola marinus]
MARFWISVTIAVCAVAALKTAIVVSLFLPTSQTNGATVSGLFAAFTALTAVVAYFCYSQLRKYLERQRQDRIEDTDGSPVAKETVIARCAREWRLSQAEADIAIFVVKGFSNNEIAEMRGCALATVKSQLGSIYQKSGHKSRYQLIAFVTDEVCAMAKDPKFDPAADIRAIATQSILPLIGRFKKVA